MTENAQRWPQALRWFKKSDSGGGGLWCKGWPIFAQCSCCWLTWFDVVMSFIKKTSLRLNATLMAVWKPPLGRPHPRPSITILGILCLHLFKSNECVQAATARHNKTGKSLALLMLLIGVFSSAFYLARSLFHPVVWATPAATACM